MNKNDDNVQNLQTLFMNRTFDEEFLGFDQSDSVLSLCRCDFLLLHQKTCSIIDVPFLFFSHYCNCIPTFLDLFPNCILMYLCTFCISLVSVFPLSFFFFIYVKKKKTQGWVGGSSMKLGCVFIYLVRCYITIALDHWRIQGGIAPLPSLKKIFFLKRSTFFYNDE